MAGSCSGSGPKGLGLIRKHPERQPFGPLSDASGTRCDSHDIFFASVDPVPVDQTLSEALQLSAHVNELYRIRETILGLTLMSDEDLQSRDVLIFHKSIVSRPRIQWNDESEEIERSLIILDNCE
jgi:hypothetical protein